MREGNYWLSIKGGPTGKEFYMFESGIARNLFEAKRARELGRSVNDLRTGQDFTSGDDITSMRNAGAQDSQMLSQMFKDIDAATASPGFSKDALKDQLYQTYLLTLPEQSFRKQFIHAEDVTGFSADILRNFTTSAMRAANQSSKLKYGNVLYREVQRAKDSLAGNPESAKLGLFIKELEDRSQEELNPPAQSALVTGLNKIAYLWLLTSAASASVQLVSIPVMVMPKLNVQYGYGKAAKSFSKFMFHKSMGVTRTDAQGNVTYHAPSLGNLPIVMNSPLLTKAFKEFVSRGLTTDTNTAVLTDRNRTPDNTHKGAIGTAARGTANVMSALFNGAERLSRESAAMMTFELEYAKTKDFDASIQKAVDLTQETLGRYDSFSRPKIMRNALGKTLGQFKMYAVNMTSYFIRNAYNMHKVLYKGQRKEGLDAMHQLAGTLTMGAMFHGLVGMPLYSTVTAAIDLAMDAFGDEEEKKRRRVNNPLSARNSDMRFRYEFLPTMFGNIKITGLDGRPHDLGKILEKGAISELTDMNIGSRTTFDNMWFRGIRTGKDTKETLTNTLVDNLGPGVSTILNVGSSIDDFNDGKILKGLEKLLPAFFKSPITAVRVAGEGVTNKRGASILKKDEISIGNIVAQAAGFPSSRAARIQEQTYKTMQETMEASNARKKILTRLDDTFLSGESSEKDRQGVINQLRQHNSLYGFAKGIAIDMDTINASIDSAIKSKGLTLRGQQIRKNLLPYVIKLYRASSPTQE